LASTLNEEYGVDTEEYDNIVKACT